MSDEEDKEKKEEGGKDLDTQELEVEKMTRYEQFDEFFEERSGEEYSGKVAIITQFTPDPDAIGSALGLQWILETKYGLLSSVFCGGDVSHPQNHTALNVLDVRLYGVNDFDVHEYDTVVVVDTVPQNTGFEDIVDEFHAVFDHHKFDIELELTDIRNNGSCCSIIWDYLDHFGVDYESERGIVVATALLFGLRNDTDDLLSEDTSELDMKAHSNLMSKIDHKKLQDIIRFPYPSYQYDLKAQAFGNKVVHDSVLISSLGIISSKRRDALPIIADEFIRMEGVETVIVFAIIEDRVEASVRSRNASINVHDFCQRIFGENYAGGKHGAGGAKVPLGFLYSQSDDEELRAEICETAQKIIKQRIISFLNG